MKRSFLAALAVALFIFQSPLALTAGKVFLWKGVSGQSTVYLMGSIHMADKSFYPMDPAIESAFAESGRLVVEVDVTTVNQEQILSLMMKKGFYEADDSIENHIAASTFRSLEDYFGQMGLPVEMVSRMKPWAAYMMVEQTELGKLGLDPALGVDMHFINQAKKIGKPVGELETIESQMELLAGFDDSVQEGLMISSLGEREKRQESIRGMVAAWKAGDAKKMESLLFEPLYSNPSIYPVYEGMFFARNAVMTEKIAKMASPAQPVFVVVGAGHLLGEKGIVSLLMKKGFVVYQIPSAK